MGRFLADIDANRSYAGRGGIIGEVLEYAAGEGFGDVMGRVVQKQEALWTSAARFRQRFLIAAIEGLKA